MYHYSFVFYSKYRRPVSTTDLYARNKAEALAQVKNHIAKDVRGYSVKSTKVTREYCFCEIIKNGYYVRIGACLLTFMDDETIEVYDWNGNKSVYDDLILAVDAFIAGVNNVG